MSPKNLFVLILSAISQLAVGQVDVKTGFSDNFKNSRYMLPEESDMLHYQDSISSVYSQKFLTVYTFSVFNEVLPNEALLYSFDGEPYHETKSDSRGRLFLIPQNKEARSLHIKSVNTHYHQSDTLISWKNHKDQPLIIWLHPRYKIVIRGRVIVGTLPLGGIQAEIIHNNDTMNSVTQSCYTDNEDYWNCLYNGMFIQEVVFDNPADNITINLSKEGLNDKSLFFACGDYDGRVLPIKMKYTKELPKAYKHNLLLKVGLPVNNCWMFAFNYKHMLVLGNFNRFGAGIETGMIMTQVQKEIPTFPNLNSGADSLSIIARSDTSYISTYFSPDFVFWISNPQNRRFAGYFGLQVPYFLNQNKFYFHPYMGGRVFLDMNKAFFGEMRYLNYGLDVVGYEFNPYGKATSNTINEHFNQLYFNVGIMVSF